MRLLSSIGRFFRRRPAFRPSAEAYDLWAASYDEQPGNLMLDLDTAVVKELLAQVPVTGMSLVDVGCGTGRHWPSLLERQPHRLLGFDSSAGMIAKLKQKFGETARVSAGPRLDGVDAESTDLLISTLTIAHIEDPGPYFTEWQRVLKPGGLVLLTDYHPQALAKGAKRTFQHAGGTVAIRNYVHSIEKLRALAEQLGWVEQRFIEKHIDESVKPYYEAQNALPLYDAFAGTPIIYGLLLKKC